MNGEMSEAELREKRALAALLDLIREIVKTEGGER